MNNSDLKILSGYTPGIIGRVVEMHASFYSRTVGFGVNFEALVASGLAEFMPRAENPGNAIWHVSNSGQTAGSIVIDGEDIGDDIAHLRWFILSDGLRGAGLGRELMRTATKFCDAHNYREIHLWTFKGLDAARALYEAFDFVLVEEQAGDQWGTEVIEQKFVRKLPT